MISLQKRGIEWVVFQTELPGPEQAVYWTTCHTKAAGVADYLRQKEFMRDLFDRVLH